MFEINSDDLQSQFEKMEAFSAKLKSVIDPFLKDNLEQKKVIELCQVGKFLVLLSEDSRIIEHSESPDFIISFNACKIGLEHQRIFKSDEVESIHSISKLFDDAADLFKNEHPEHKILVNCWLSTNNFQFTKAESNKLKKEISDFIYSYITKTPTVKPNFIERVFIMPHSDVSFEYNSGGFIIFNIDDETLKNAIKKKELLVPKYKETSKLDRQWLLLIIGNVGPHSFRFRDEHIKAIESSNFERIYLLEDFDGKVWRLF